MKNKLIVVASILFLSASASSQETTNDTVIKDKSAVSGFYNRVNFGLLAGSDLTASFHVVNGYRFNERWSTGVGVGAENYRWNSFLPLFLEGNYQFFKSGSSPYASIMAGYLLPYRNFPADKGGFTCGGDVGFNYFLGKHVGITTAVGYRFAYLRNANNFWDDFQTIQEVNRYSVRIGVIFK
jgi:opacity protein-like surface antigen